MATRQEVADAAGCTPEFISNCVNRNVLLTPLGETTAGVARDFSFDNALELAFIAALVVIGYSPIDAAIKAAEWRALEAEGELLAFWAENARTRQGVLMSKAPKDLAALAATFQDRSGRHYEPATALAIIHVREIVKRVEALFAD
ncbi:hypothetical protein [Methylocystis sp.]|uniref:hypothetical protein n=1 Tax=Methylocystis sp. TaxID=1911079 RepID=UPI003DA5CD20